MPKTRRRTICLVCRRLERESLIWEKTGIWRRWIWLISWASAIRQFQAGREEFPIVKDITLQLTLTICLKIIWNTNRHCLHLLYGCGRCLFVYSGWWWITAWRGISSAEAKMKRGNPKGAKPLLAHDFAWQSVVCYILYLCVCEKSVFVNRVLMQKQTKRAWFLCQC